tara:strand:- start:4357 stop:5307 length:951 start_codon:yes stop_codon:yes gene_type:complete
MKEFCSIEGFEERNRQAVMLALGMFDGVHVGHQAVLNLAVEQANAFAGTAVAFSFPMHPSTLLRPEQAPPLLMNPETKAKHLILKGMQEVILQPFDHEFSQMEATGFVEFLCAHIPTLHTLCIGKNFRFGKNRIGDHLLLRESANAFGLQVLVAESESWGDGPISSSRIRAALEEGRIVDVNQMLGRKYLMEGMVCSGNAVGRTIGFPTLNLNWNPQAHPCFGVYAGMVKNLRNDQKLPAVANYGVRPTLEKSSCEPLLEIHLLVEPDTEQWRTGVELHMELDFFLRPEKAFAALDDLKAQIQSDKNQALELLSPL